MQSTPPLEILTFSHEGQLLIARLVCPPAGERIVFHVGRLPEDVTNPENGFRTAEVPPAELTCIAELVEVLVADGRCRFEQHQIAEGLFVYMIVGA